jgi:two-component system chemotaxis sensor kinase CheA
MNKDLESALAAGEMFVPPEELADVFVQLKAALGGQGSWDMPGAAKTGSCQPDAQTCLETAQEQAMAVDASFSDASPASDSQALDAGSDLPSQPGSGALPEMNSEAAAANGGATHAGKTVRQTMKIDADRIDLLLETIGELVIVESIVSQEVAERQGQARDLERNLGQLKKITRSLQDIGMSMRLIPIDNTFRKMGRLVRDLSKKSGKKIELVMEGRETELDKGMVEKLGDPLVHMIRNAVDHGIEPTADDRIAAGKPATGTIVLKAYHQGGNIHIDITDDGRGLDRDAILAKAVERGLATGEDNMSDEDIYSLIFEPGFSTAKQITDVSGRGVGMDVVKSNIESMRGNVRIKSQKGFGSTFTLVLPLTMAIIDGMIVRVGSERYILPLLSIIESFQPTKKMITTVSGKGETVPFRNRLLPLFRLSSVFKVSDAQSDPTKALVVVLEDAGRQIALLVDELLGQNQTVIKNLGQGLKHIDGIAGASIMPDGTPGLIVDVNGLVKLATA